jgi:serine/threonine protein kinase
MRLFTSHAEHMQSHPAIKLRDISRGLVYLHKENVVHGDLKAVNVLMDDSAKAVLCDFGLSRVKSDVTTRTARVNTTPLVGSRNWMAPERLVRGTLRKPCDVYSFGMTVYEIYSNEVPLDHLSHLSYSEVVNVVVHQDIRPERPEDDGSVQLHDVIWELAECCWKKDAATRPTATAICDMLSLR